MRPDPYEGSYVPYDPQSMNRYSYVGNRPLIFMDQYGLSCVTFDDGSMGDDGDGNGCAAAFIDPDGTDEDMEVVNVDGGAWGDDGNGGPWGGTIYGAIGPGGSSGGGGGGSGNCSQQPGGGPSGGIVYGTGGGVGAGAGGQGYTNSGTATNYAGQQGTAVSQTYNTNSNTILGLLADLEVLSDIRPQNRSARCKAVAGTQHMVLVPFLLPFLMVIMELTHIPWA